MASNPDFDEGQRALATNNDGVPAPKLPPAVRKLADTLSPGALDGAPSPVGQDLDAPRRRRQCAPVPKTPRPPKRARAAPKDGDAQLAARPAPAPALPPGWRGSSDDKDDALELDSDLDSDGDNSDRDGTFAIGSIVADIEAPQFALEVVAVSGDTYTLKYGENAGGWRGRETKLCASRLMPFGGALPPRRGRAAPPAQPPKRALKATTPDAEPPRATPSPTPTPPARAAPTPSCKRRAPFEGVSDSDDGEAPPRRARPSTSGDAAFAAALAKSLANEDAAPSPSPTEGDAALAAALAAPPPPEGDEAFARALAGVDGPAAPAPTRAHDDAAVPEESTVNDEAIAAAFADGSSDDEDAAPSAPARIPKYLQDKNKSGVCDPFAAPESHVDLTRPPPRRACTQQRAPAERPRNLKPLPAPLPPSPPRRRAAAASPFVVRQEVMAQHDGGLRFYRATITAVRSDPPSTFDVDYYDDDQEEAVVGSLIKRALPPFDVDFGRKGKHRGTVIEEDGDGVTIQWRPVHLKRGEKETPEVEERSHADLGKYLAAFRTGGRVHDVGPSAGLFVELFAGRAGLSRAMRGLNWRTVTADDGSWPGAAVPTVRGDIRELRLAEVSAVDGAEGRVAVHASLPCKTWSCQAVDGHRPGRVLDGARISAEARDANDVVRHVIGELRYLQRVCPDAIITVENPQTGELKNYKPWKAACSELGLEAVDVTYCKFGAPHRKPTRIWTNCKGLIDAAAPGLWFCGGAYKCRNWRNHAHVEGADASESSEFPEAFCTWMGAHINTEADRRAALRDN